MSADGDTFIHVHAFRNVTIATHPLTNVMRTSPVIIAPAMKLLVLPLLSVSFLFLKASLTVFTVTKGDVVDKNVSDVDVVVIIV